MPDKIDLGLLNHTLPAVRYGYAKELYEAVRHDPAAYLDETTKVVRLLSDARSIMRWTAIDMLGCMAEAAPEREAREALVKLYPFLKCGLLIDTAHALYAVSRIARAHPSMQGRVLIKMCQVDQVTYKTEVCRQIVIGHAIRYLFDHVGLVTFPPSVMSFISRAAGSSRKATAKRAEALLKKLI